MLIGKLVLFIVGNYIVLEFNKQKPEDLMKYPGFGYCLVMHFGLGQLLYMAIVAMRYYRSRSLREYVARRIRHLVGI